MLLEIITKIKCKTFKANKKRILIIQNFSPKKKCAIALLLYSLAFSSSSLKFTLIPSV